MINVLFFLLVVVVTRPGEAQTTAPPPLSTTNVSTTPLATTATTTGFAPPLSSTVASSTLAANTTASPFPPGTLILEWWHIAGFVAAGFGLVIATCYAVFMWQHNALRTYTNTSEAFLKEIGAERRKLAVEVEKNEEDRAARGLPVGQHFDYQVPEHQIRKTRVKRQGPGEGTAAPQQISVLAGSLRRPLANESNTTKLASMLTAMQRRDERSALSSANRAEPDSVEMHDVIAGAVGVHRNLEQLRRNAASGAAMAL